MPLDHVWSVSDFVAAFNQTLEFAYPSVQIEGELANFKVSKNKWVYFDLKDDNSSVRFFGNVYALPGPLEDGMTVLVAGSPRLHPQYGFSVSVQTIRPVGEGTIKKAAALLQAKLTAEGLFDEIRKRSLPYPPVSIGLITSSESAAYQDFIKILNKRWGGVEISLIDTQVQGELAATQIISAVEFLNRYSKNLEIIVVIRGGGSADDLQAFSTEQVTRAIAASRIPTLVAIGHESDTSLAELAADLRASTPSNAAELMVPDKAQSSQLLKQTHKALVADLRTILQTEKQTLGEQSRRLSELLKLHLRSLHEQLERFKQLLQVLDPSAALKRGYAILTLGDATLRTVSQVKIGTAFKAQLKDGQISASVTGVSRQS